MAVSEIKKIEEYMADLQQSRHGHSFAFLAERVESRQEAAHHLYIMPHLNGEDAAAVVLGGTGDAGNNLRAYNGYLKKVQNFARSVEEIKNSNLRLAVAICNYGHYYNEYLARDLWYKKLLFPAEYSKTMAENQRDLPDTLFPQYERDIFNAVILPRIAGRTMKGREQRLSFADAQRRIGKLVLIGHCHGAHVAMKLEHMMGQKMAELGYDNTEIRRIQSQLTLIAYAPEAPLHKSNMRVIAFASAQDTHNPYQTLYDEYLRQKDFGVVYFGYNNCDIMRCTAIDKAGIEGNPPRVMKLQKVDGNWFDEITREKAAAQDLHGPETPDADNLSEHEFLGFTAKDNMSNAAKLMQRFFGNAVKNSLLHAIRQTGNKYQKLPSTDKLLAENKNQRRALCLAKLQHIKQMMMLTYFGNKKKLRAQAAWRQQHTVRLG